MKKPLPGTPSGNVTQTYTPAESAGEDENKDATSIASSDTSAVTSTGITDSHIDHSAHNDPAPLSPPPLPSKSRKAPVIIAITLIVAIIVGVYFLFFNKSKSKWEEYDDSDLWESETEAVNYYEDF